MDSHIVLNRKINLDEQEAYWRRQLSGKLTVLEIPLDYPRTLNKLVTKSREVIELDEKFCLKLDNFCLRENITIFTILLAVLKVILLRYTRQKDIIVSSLITDSIRQKEGVNSENFINAVLLRTNLIEELTAKEALKSIAKTVEEATQNRDYPFEELIAVLEKEGNLKKTPIFQFMLVPCSLPFSLSEINTLLESLTEIQDLNTRCDILIFPDQKEEKLIINCEYNSELFESASIKRMLGHIQTMLDNFIHNVNDCISTLPLLTEAEQHQLLNQWNNTQTDEPQDKFTHQLFEAQVESTPEMEAVVYKDQQLTYLKLNRKANQVAHYLRSLEVSPEMLVGICIDRSLDMVVSLLGILKAGAAYVPLDSAYPQDRLAYMLSDSQVRVLLTTEKLLTALPQLAQASGGYKIVCLDRDWQAINQQSEENPLIHVQPHNLAYVMYTSGSTGNPKGVAMTHLALANLINWQLRNTTVSNKAKTLQFAPLSFDVSFQEIFSTWCSGGTLVLISEEVRRNPIALLNLLTEKRIERLFLPFIALQQLAEAVNSASLPMTIREVITAGEQLQISKAIANLFGQINCTLYNHYGPTESHVIITYKMIGEVNNWPALPPIGRPIDNVQIYILDNFLQPVPIGIPGELYLGGDCLASGYLNRPELTQEKFIINPFGSGRLYKTGDLARYLKDGNIQYLGRADHQVKIRGYRIELGEIEAVLTQHPAVRESAVLPREDIPGHKRLVAYVVPSSAAFTLTQELDVEQIPQWQLIEDTNYSQSTADINPKISDASSTLPRKLTAKLKLILRSYLQESLPEYMVPTAFVLLHKMPVTPSGKLDRRALPIPERSRPELSTVLVMPESDAEKLIAKVWQEVLQLDIVGIHDNFFELGGYSLLLLQVSKQLVEIFGLELSSAAMFQYPTIYTLAQHLSPTNKQTSTIKHQQNSRTERDFFRQQQQRQLRQTHRDRRKL